MRSTMVEELTTLDTTSVEAKFLHELLTDLPMAEKTILAISMTCDSQSE